MAHNRFGFDFLVLLAEVERRPRQFASSIFEDDNINFSDTLPLLRKILRMHHGIYGIAWPMKKDEDEKLAGITLGIGSLYKSLYKHFVGTDVECKVTRSSII